MPFFRVFYYYLLFTLFWLWTLFHFVADLRPLLEMRTLFRDKLNLQDYQLQVVSWDEIIVKLIDLQKTGACALPRAPLNRSRPSLVATHRSLHIALVQQRASASSRMSSPPTTSPIASFARKIL